MTDKKAPVVRAPVIAAGIGAGLGAVLAILVGLGVFTGWAETLAGPGGDVEVSLSFVALGVLAVVVALIVLVSASLASMGHGTGKADKYDYWSKLWSLTAATGAFVGALTTMFPAFSTLMDFSLCFWNWALAITLSALVGMAVVILIRRRG